MSAIEKLKQQKHLDLIILFSEISHENNKEILRYSQTLNTNSEPILFLNLK